jgi:methionyl-tRNA formyltransferase
MRFAFAGIDFLGGVFDELIRRGWQPVRLFTRPCDGIYDFNEEVIARAWDLRVPVQSSRIRSANLAALKELRCETLVVAGYPWLVTGWEPYLPYALNFHPSPLPTGRGPYPLFRAILDNVPSWGMSVHRLEPAFDTGALVAQELFPLEPTETHDTLLARCQMASRRLAAALVADLPRLWDDARAQGEGSYWRRISDRERTIDWNSSPADILRVVRAFGSIEALASVGGKQLYVAAASGWNENHAHRPGTVVHRHRRHLTIAARGGFVQLTDWSQSPAETRRRQV